MVHEVNDNENPKPKKEPPVRVALTFVETIVVADLITGRYEQIMGGPMRDVAFGVLDKLLQSLMEHTR